MLKYSLDPIASPLKIFFDPLSLSPLGIVSAIQELLDFPSLGSR